MRVLLAQQRQQSSLHETPDGVLLLGLGKRFCKSGEDTDRERLAGHVLCIGCVHTGGLRESEAGQQRDRGGNAGEE